MQDAKVLLAQQRNLQFALQEAQDEAAAAVALQHEEHVRACRARVSVWVGGMICSSVSSWRTGLTR